MEDRLDSGSSVLELGSGTGRPVAERLASRHRYLGVDVSAAMVTTARRNVRGGRFRVADMRYVDLPVGDFDAVVAFYSIIHVPRSDQPALLSRIYAWLRPGGYFVASFSSEDLAAGVDEDWLGAGPMYWSGYDAATNIRMLIDAGFEVIRAEVVPQIEPDGEVRFLWCTTRRPVPQADLLR
ncbi:MAG TPA: class I SAM-dependent methyltransferase [Actinobacteria bacterium]|nr:class I SAM-dependent methyltransferase [Actinomycetota bacterium]